MHSGIWRASLTLAATIAICAPAGACLAQPVHEAAQTCPTDPLAPAHMPVVALDTRPTAAGVAAAYGGMQYRRSSGLAPKEIALTFDDGPNPNVTPRVLSVLRQHCMKATFFMVGWYAKARPDLVRAVAADGHFIGTHTWDHPDNLRRLTPAAAESQITRGFEAVHDALATAPAAEQAQIAPLFRFPGLNDSPYLISWLAERDIAVVSADMGTDDWRGIGPAAIEYRALRYANESGGGIVIMHDTKPATAESLSDVITLLEQRGYRFVQLVPAPGARERALSVPASLLYPVQPAVQTATVVAASAAPGPRAADPVGAWIQTCIQSVQDATRDLVAQVQTWGN